MNSRSSVNESNLVNYSTDLSTLNQLDTKDSLLSFPFDHIYACHSDSADRRQTLQLDKEVEISAHCVVEDEKDLLVTNPELNQLTTKLTIAESQNKKLKDLLIYHLDLIQQQNDLMTKREKVFQALKQENETLKNKLNRMDKKVSVNPRQSVNPPPLVNVAPSTVTSAVIKKEPSTPPQMMFNSFTELLLPENRSNSYIFNSDITKPKPYGQDSYELGSTTESDVTSFLPSDLAAPVMSILDDNRNSDNFTMIENKRSFIKKEIKTEPRPEPLYTVTSNSGNPVIQKIQRNKRRTSGIGSLSRMSRNPTPKVELSETNKTFEEDKGYERTFNINKKNKLLNTYGKSKTTIPKKTTQFTGSLSDRLQLIDTTPTGEDPYQLGEADMREQSPIPKLMLQKSHNRMKLSGDNPSTATSTRRIYDPAIPETTTKSTTTKSKVDRYPLSSTFVPDPKKELPKTIMAGEPDLDLVKTEPDIDWQMFATSKSGNETSLCDFSYGENSNNLATSILPGLDSVEFQDFFNPDSPLNLDSLNPVDFASMPEHNAGDKSKRRGARTTSLMNPDLAGASGLGGMTDFASPGPLDSKRGVESKRGRKRAMSATGVTKKREPKQSAAKAKPKGKAAGRGKKAPVPGMMTSKPYHTLMGDPDLTWYLGLDPDLKFEDIVPTDASKTSTAATVEVPRWREKPYTSCYTLEGTENLDDKVFEKRHHKLEAEERRQLRWHMRRVREQRHVERLRLRQRDWCGGSASPAYQHPAIYTIWPQPQRDAHFIEITESLPVMAFGEILPALPESDFILPWVRTSKALKRANRAKTLH